MRGDITAYTIKQVAEKTNLTIPTIRYYEKEGILPAVHRNEVGNRMFCDEDLDWLGLICCLRNTGMPIRKIKQFVKWCLDGDDTIDNRIEMLIEHKKSVTEQIAVLQHYQQALDCKIKHHEATKQKILNGRKTIQKG